MVKQAYKILIVDDDRSIRDALEEFLESKGYDVETAGNAKAAIDMVKDIKFDIFVVDLKLPDSSGIEVLKSINQLDPEVVAIIMTGFASIDTAIQAIKEGAYDYLAKPFMLEEMNISIRNACEKIFLRNQHKALMEELRRLRNYAGTVKANIKEDELLSPDSDSSQVLGELERLAGLVERGMITEDELDILKERYLRE